MNIPTRFEGVFKKARSIGYDEGYAAASSEIEALLASGDISGVVYRRNGECYTAIKFNGTWSASDYEKDVCTAPTLLECLRKLREITEQNGEE